MRTITYKVDFHDNKGKTGISQLLTAALISGVVITPGSYRVYDTTTYTFMVNNTNALGAGSILRIRFPIEIKLSGPVCKINGANVVFNKLTVNSRDVLEVTLLNNAVAQYALFN